MAEPGGHDGGTGPAGPGHDRSPEQLGRGRPSGGPGRVCPAWDRRAWVPSSTVGPRPRPGGGSGRACWPRHLRCWPPSGAVTVELCRQWQRAARSTDVGAVWRHHVTAGVTVMTAGEAGFPSRLLDDPEPPAVLFSTGVGPGPGRTERGDRRHPALHPLRPRRGRRVGSRPRRGRGVGRVRARPRHRRRRPPGRARRRGSATGRSRRHRPRRGLSPPQPSAVGAGRGGRHRVHRSAARHAGRGLAVPRPQPDHRRPGRCRRGRRVPCRRRLALHGRGGGHP